MDKMIRPKARPQKSKLEQGSSLVPRTRSKAREQELKRGDVEFRSDLEAQLWYNPLARLGYDPTKVKTMPQELGANAMYFPPSNTKESVERALAKDASLVDPAARGTGRVNPDDAVFFSGTAQSPIVSHELSHRGVQQVLEYYKEDPTFFREKYGEQAAKKLERIADPKDPYQVNEALTELFDDLGATLNIPSSRRTTSMGDTRDSSFKSTQEEFQKYIAKTPEEDRWSHQERRYAAEIGILKAAEDLLKTKGEPPKTKPDYPNFIEKTFGFRFAEGGLTMDKQMNKLFAEGGINTEETNVDPVSGNEVPPGSLPSEVRDDVDAKLSGGEYVVPADVLRYYGVSFFEKLRKKAKEGLGEMDAEGRIGGGKPEEEEEDDFPFSVEELETEDEMAFAEGGTVPTQAPAATGFNPNDWSYDSTNVMGQSTGVTQMKKYKDKNGNIVQILFIDGKPVVDVDALGYTEYTEKKPVATGENVAPTEVLAQEKPFENSNESGSDRMDTNKPESAPIDPADNYYNMSAEELLGIDYNSIKGNKNAKFAGAIGTLALGPAVALGFGAAGAFQEANNLADARARSKIGKELNYDTTEFDKKIAEMEKASSKITDGLEALGGLTGENIQKRMQNSLGTSAPVATTPGIITKTPSPIKKPITPSIASSEPSPSSVTPSGLLSASSYSKQESDRGGGYTPTTQAKDSKETVVQAQQRAGAIASGKAQAAGATTQAKDISSSAYSGKGYTQGRAKGGLVEKPKKVVTPKTKRKTKI